MRRHTTMGFAVAALTLVGSGGVSAQIWGRPDTPRSGVCFYEGVNFGGQYFCASTGRSTAQVPAGTNDRISSIRIFGDAEVTVYGDANFEGRSRTFGSSVSDLREMGLNDRISSFRTERRGVGTSGSWNNGRWSDDRPADGGWRENNGRNGRRYEGRRGYQAAESMVVRAYHSVLNREPDPSGLRSWTQNVIDNNWSEQDLINQLKQSDEYRESHRPWRR
jgi:Peptidase inhibitor family I36/Domain of unknown function (DUF4214)